MLVASLSLNFGALANGDKLSSLKKQKECNEFYNTLAKREANYTLGITLKPQNAPKNYKKETLK